MAANYGIQVGFNNDVPFIGSQILDIAWVMDTLDSKDAGYYYDLGNATEAGAVVGWRIAADWIMPRMKMLGIQDFYWKQTERRGWQATNCPLGQGMCKCNEFLKMAAVGGFHGPISIKVEYQIPGVSDQEGVALSRENDGEVMAAAHRDLETLKPLLRAAYEGA